MPVNMNNLVSLFRKDGYVVLKNSNNENEVLSALFEIHRLFKEQLVFLDLGYAEGESEAVILKNMEKLFKNDLDRYKATLRQVNKLFCIQKLVTADPIIHFVRSLGLEILSFPTDSVFHCMAGGLLIPDGYMRLKPHQDWPAMQSSLDSVIVWSSLMDIASESKYPLEVIPGSHRNGLLPGITHDHVYEVAPDYYDSDNFVPVLVERSDVIIFSSFLIHRTGLGGTNELRLACSTRYENAVEKTNVQRAYPSIHRRIVDREIKTKNFPEKHHVEHLFGPNLKGL